MKWKETKEHHGLRRSWRATYRNQLRRCAALPDLEGRLALSALKILRARRG